MQFLKRRQDAKFKTPAGGEPSMSSTAPRPGGSRGLRGDGYSQFHADWLVRAGLISGFILSFILPAHAEYRLQAGDVIEVSVAGVPELRQRVPIQLDGTISFPVVGSVHIAGLNPAEMRAKIQSTLASKVFRTRTSDGREQPRTVEPDEIAATVVEYRPIYVSGDVARPGEQMYRPHMTVRQALALSGGDSVRLREAGPHVNSAALQSDYTTTWLNLFKEHARAWRVKNELGEKASFNPQGLPPAPIPPALATQLLTLETDYQQARESNHEREREFLEQAVKQADGQIEILTDQQQKEEEGIQADLVELQKATELFGKGTLISQRVTDARRAVLLSATRKLQTASQLMLVQRQRNDFQRQLSRHDEQRRMNLLRELQEANVNISSHGAKLRSIDETLRSAGAAPPRNMTGAMPTISVFRRNGDSTARIAADYDFLLEPGDTVEVVLQFEPQNVPVQ